MIYAYGEADDMMMQRIVNSPSLALPERLGLILAQIMCLSSELIEITKVK